jgi:RNA-directed DNA polymerase
VQTENEVKGVNQGISWMQAIANGTKTQTNWNTIDWKNSKRIENNLRQRIFRATQEGDWKKVRSLQKLVLRSRSVAQNAVRRVTQTNQGKNTPGVDKVVVKTPEARGRLVDELLTFQPWRAKPARRVYIPKANGKERPLGIPTVIDRAMQAIVKTALEPVCESVFERMSYGFRPGRSAQDAMAKIYTLAKATGLKQWVLDADIKGAFDNISHEYLLNQLSLFPGRELIKQWLKAGYMEDGAFYETHAGTPQGGIISPLLANIALHGMEDALGITYNKYGQNQSQRAVVRYADDFVVFCETKEDAENCKQILAQWLTARGLTLSEEKTQIAHIKEGFDFLGFNVRQYWTKKNERGWKLQIKPSKKSVKKIRERLRKEWQSLNGHSAEKVIKRLNPIIRGWANYFRTQPASRTFKALDHWMFQKELKFLRQQHPKKAMQWIYAKYFASPNKSRTTDNWLFRDETTGMELLKFGWFPIEKHILVKGTASPDDPSLKEYWEARQLARTSDLAPNKHKLAKKQKGKCPTCGGNLMDGERLETHHIIPKTVAEDNRYTNLILVHYYCHQQLTAQGKTRNV